VAEEPSARRPRLNRETVLRTAVALADRVGLDGFTMRTLSQELGVVPMALYKHVANKDELLDGMVDLVWAEVHLPDGAAGWKAAMRGRAVSLRDALSRHRWAVGLMESRMSPGPENLRHHDAMMGCLRESGFSFRTTVHCTSTLDAYVYGFALQQKTLPFETPEESGVVAAQKQSAQPDPAAVAAMFPYLAEVVVELARSGYDYDLEFQLGLDLILDGIEKLRPEWSAGS